MAIQVSAKYCKGFMAVVFNSRYIYFLERKSLLFRQLGTDNDLTFKRNLEKLASRQGLITEKPIISDQNYFELFGFETSYDIDEDMLKKRFISLQKILHPDKYSSKSKDEQELSALYSSTTNKAFKTLSNPYKRGLYLLKLNNLSIEEDEKGLNLDDEFLEEIMSLNEIILDSESEKTDEVKKDMQNRIDESIKIVSECFKTGNLNKAKETLGKLKFYLNIYEKITVMES